MFESLSDPSEGPLAGVRVLDLTQVMAGAYCTMLLADMGADVVKVERPDGGDDTRRMSSGSDVESSPAFAAVNRNKRGVAINLKDTAGVALIRRMAADYDVVVENFRPGMLDALGLGHDQLCAENPNLVYCSISGFGATGPYSEQGGYDLVAQAMSGLMSMTGEPGRPPVKVGVPICDLNAGLFAAYGVLCAYLNRLRTGQGQFVDTSLLEAGIAYTVWESALLFSSGHVAEPQGSAHRLSAPYEVLPTADGWIAIGAANQRNWQRLCDAIGDPGLAVDDRYADNALRMSNRARLAGELAVVLSSRTTAEWLTVLHAAGVPSGPVHNIKQVYEDPHVRARDMVVHTDHPRMGHTAHIGSPIKLSKTPASVRRPAPLLGQHTVEVLAQAGLSTDEIAVLQAAGVVHHTPVPGFDPGVGGQNGAELDPAGPVRTDEAIRR